jgi:pilus assembly protein FimV
LLPSVEMSRSARARLVCSAAVALLAGALGGGCGTSPPTDKNFGTDLGADFRAPITDAGSDGATNVTPEASVDGTSTGGTTASDGATGTGGGAGAAGSGGTTGAGGAAGNAGAAGAGA